MYIGTQSSEGIANSYILVCRLCISTFCSAAIFNGITIDVKSPSKSHDTLLITWENPTNTFQDSFTYTINVTIISSGIIIVEELKAYTRQQVPSIEFDIKQQEWQEHACEKIVFSVAIFNSNQIISQEGRIPAC